MNEEAFATTASCFIHQLVRPYAMLLRGPCRE